MNAYLRCRPYLPWIVAAGLTAAIFVLRWPTFGFRVWNVDEAIHATIARTLLDGGVLYRDAIDQRTPLSYYTVAALFGVFGENNIWAMHALAAALIAATTWGLLGLGRIWSGLTAGLGAALLYLVFSTALFYPGDAYALHTEWFVASFTTWAAWAFWRGKPLAAGGCLGLAFLSKQPALLDGGAPLLVLAHAVINHPRSWLKTSKQAALLGIGFIVPVLSVAGYFAAHGVWRDCHFYAWDYNLQYYAPEISTQDRVLSALKPFSLLATEYPLILASLLLTGGYWLVRVLQLRPLPAEETTQSRRLYLLAWGATSLAGAAAGGRAYDHYFIQFLPPCCLIAALGWAELWAWTRAHRAQRILCPLVAVVAAATLYQLGSGVLRFRSQASQPEDPSRRAGEFIKKHTSPAERIFVWGYHPDLYVFSDRRPASRFVYASFLSGLIPWTNTAPAQDTTATIVPGARETLLQELAQTRPAFIVDCSAGPNRFWAKYPLTTFPALQAFIEKNYALAEPAQFGGQGFRLYLSKDSFRRSPLALTGEHAASLLEAPQLLGPVEIGRAAIFQIGVSSSSTNGQLQRLEVLHNGQVLTGASFPPSDRMLLNFSVPVDQLGAGEHRLSARATASDGAVRSSEEQIVTVGSGHLPEERLREFALPQVTSRLTPLSVRAPYGAAVDQQVFQVHAPATLSYSLASGNHQLRGQFGFQPGAYAATNTAPTDGAEFLVVVVFPDGHRQTLFHRWLQPAREPADGGPQTLNVTLPPNAAGTLELVTTNGPAGNAASDWTYWADLRLETSR